VVLALGILTVSACGADSSRTEQAAPRPTWAASFPEVGPAKLNELTDIISAPPKPEPVTLDVGELPAAVFCLGCEAPDVEHAEWQDLMDRLCGSDRLAQLAVSEGWTIQITGFVDESGPHGPGTANAHLPLARARASAAAIQKGCSIPASSIETYEGGISPNNIRKIVIAFHRPSTEQETFES
jgi:hypothetical protein